MLRREFIGALTAGAASAQVSGEVKRTEIARLPDYTEGVVVDRNGDLYISHAESISKVTPTGRVTPWSTTPSPNETG